MFYVLAFRQPVFFNRLQKTFSALAGIILLMATPVMASAANINTATPTLNVVASFSILADMVSEIGGDRITLATIVGSDSDAHTFEPAPRDAKALATAQVLVVNGQDFEGWLPRLLQAAHFKGIQIVASNGVQGHALDGGNDSHDDHDENHEDDHHDAHSHGNIDPHMWQSLENGMVYARNIAAGLATADPENAAYYADRAHDYIARMQALDLSIKSALAQIPAARRKVITAHDAFGYFGRAYGIQFISATGVANQAQPSAKNVAAIVSLVQQEKIAAVFVENVSNDKLVSQIARETDAAVGGVLYSDALAQPDQPAGTYLGMLRWNADQLINALK